MAVPPRYPLALCPTPILARRLSASSASSCNGMTDRRRTGNKVRKLVPRGGGHGRGRRHLISCGAQSNAAGGLGGGVGMRAPCRRQGPRPRRQLLWTGCRRRHRPSCRVRAGRRGAGWARGGGGRRRPAYVIGERLQRVGALGYLRRRGAGREDRPERATLRLGGHRAFSGAAARRAVMGSSSRACPRTWWESHRVPGRPGPRHIARTMSGHHPFRSGHRGQTIHLLDGYRAGRRGRRRGASRHHDSLPKRGARPRTPPGLAGLLDTLGRTPGRGQRVFHPHGGISAFRSGTSPGLDGEPAPLIALPPCPNHPGRRRSRRAPPPLRHRDAVPSRCHPRPGRVRRVVAGIAALPARDDDRADPGFGNASPAAYRLASRPAVDGLLGPVERVRL